MCKSHIYYYSPTTADVYNNRSRQGGYPFEVLVSTDFDQVTRHWGHHFGAGLGDEDLILDDEAAQPLDVIGCLEGEHHSGLGNGGCVR